MKGIILLLASTLTGVVVGLLVAVLVVKSYYLLPGDPVHITMGTAR